MRQLLNIIFLGLFSASTVLSIAQIEVIEIWPGDINNDGVVNAKDVISFGMYQGIEGPERGDFDWYIANSLEDSIEFYDQILAVDDFYDMWDYYIIEWEDEFTGEIETDTVLYGDYDSAYGYENVYYEAQWYEDKPWVGEDFDGFWFEFEDIDEEERIVYSEFGIPWAEIDADTMFNGLDFAYADCDGDGETGTISDLGEIYFNYSMGEGSRSASRGGMPLSFEYDSDTIIPGQTLTVEVKVGNDDMPLEDMYAIGMKLNLDPNIVDMEASGISFDASQMGDFDEIIPFAVKDDNALEFVLTRNDGQGKIVNGMVAKIHTVIEDDIGGSMHTLDVFDLDVSDIHLVSSSGEEIPVSVQDNGISINDTSVGLSQIAQSSWVAYPNPTSNQLNLILSREVQKIELINSLGQKVFERQNQSSNKISLDLSNQSKGIYFVKYYTKYKTVIEPVVLE